MMASYQNCKTVSLVAGEDLRGDYAAALKVNSSGRVVKTTDTTDIVVGVLAEEPRSDATTAGETVPVAVIGGGGVLKMKAALALLAGHVVVPSSITAGRVTAMADIDDLAENQMAVGVALEGAVAGDIFEVLAQTIAGPHSA